MNWLYYIEQQSVDVKVIVGGEKQPCEIPLFAKLGVSDNPKTRLTQLQTSNPLPLKLVSLRPIPSEINREQYEREVHQALSASRQQGEWFLITQRLKDWVSHNMLSVSVDEQMRMNFVDYFISLGAQQARQTSALGVNVEAVLAEAEKPKRERVLVSGIGEDFQGKPTPHQLMEYRSRMSLYTQHIPHDESMGSVMKMRTFITMLAGTPPQLMKVEQWEEVFAWFAAFEAKNNMLGLVKYVNDSLKAGAIGDEVAA